MRILNEEVGRVITRQEYNLSSFIKYLNQHYNFGCKLAKVGRGAC